MTASFVSTNQCCARDARARQHTPGYDAFTFPTGSRVASRAENPLASILFPDPADSAITRIGNQHPDSLITYPDTRFLSGCNTTGHTPAQHADR